MSVQEITDGMSKYIESDGHLNYIALIESTNTITQIFAFLITLFAGIIVIGLPIIVGIELCYINLPAIQNHYNNLYGRLEGKANQILGIVIRDALIAIERANTTEYGKNVNTIYIRIKGKQIFLAVFIVAMVLGPGPILIGYALTFVRSLIDVDKGII